MNKRQRKKRAYAKIYPPRTIRIMGKLMRKVKANPWLIEVIRSHIKRKKAERKITL